MNDCLLYRCFLKGESLMRKVGKINHNFYFIKKVMIIAVFSVVMTGINCIDIYAQSDVTKSKKGEILYSQAMEIFVTPTPDFDKSLKLLDESIPLFIEIEDKQLSYYWIAKVAYLKGVVEKDRNYHEKAEENFSFSKELILKSLEIGDFSDGYRLIADVEGQLIYYGDLYYKTKFGPGIKKFITKAIELDSGNKKAYISLAMYYRDAPFIAGGSFKKSEVVLEKMIDATLSEQIDLFSLYLWIDTAWINSNNNRKKISDCISMLKLFSNQPDIDLMVERIKKKYVHHVINIIRNH
jgi:tetratricopeptide (TPR) repeat protein